MTQTLVARKEEARETYDPPEHRADASAPITCPECGGAAVVEWSSKGFSTDGAVEHVKIHCPNRHWFLMLRDQLDR